MRPFIKNKQNLLLFGFVSLWLIFLLFPMGKPVHAQAGTAFEVLVEINNLRAANGLYQLAENQYLNLAAQNHANWIATTGLGGHTGEGGSDAKARALAVGYGEGAQVWVTENWARGSGLTAYDCVHTMWKPSAAHIQNMLNTWHDEFGAGVAIDSSGFTIYVVNFGHVSGSTVPSQSVSVPTGPTATLAPLVQPVTTSTPQGDGTVVHVVQFGQSLWAISDAYDIPMADLLALNGLTEEDAIFPDQQLLIVRGSGETPEPTPTEPSKVEMQASAQKAPTVTPRPTRMSDPTPQTSVTMETTLEVTRQGNFIKNIFSGDSLLIGIGLVLVSVLGIILLLYTSSRLK
jgi:uncharacterized protein YkwD